VIPIADVIVDPMLPKQATYWMPSEDEIDEEGIGYFRDTWLIISVPEDGARDLIAIERQITRLVDSIAINSEQFETLAHAIESADLTELPASLIDSEQYEALAGLVEDDISPLEGLELGVTGLVYALASIGCVPAASCRGHAGARSWARHPVVLFASD
jgi:hypothetical protein